MAIRALVFMFLAAAATSAAAQVVYKWTDKQGVTHYTQTPPANTKVEEKRVNPRDTKTETAPAGPNGAELRKQACESARKNMELLKSAKRVFVQAPAAAAPAQPAATAAPAASKAPTAAEPVMLSDEQRAQELKRAETQISVFCDSSTPAANGR